VADLRFETSKSVVATKRFSKSKSSLAVFTPQIVLPGTLPDRLWTSKNGPVSC